MNLLRITNFAVFCISLSTLSTATFADPYVSGTPTTEMFVEAPFEGYSPSYTTLVPGFDRVTTTGGGLADIPAPSVSISSPFLYLETKGEVTTIGPGSASEHFGETILATIANTSGVDAIFTVNFFELWDINQRGHSPDQTLSFDAFTDVVRVSSPPVPGLGNLSAGYSGGCDANGPFGYNQLTGFIMPSCNNDAGIPCEAAYYCLDVPGVGIDQPFIRANDSVSYALIMDMTFSVNEVPEPSSVMLLATILGIGFAMSSPQLCALRACRGQPGTARCSPPALVRPNEAVRGYGGVSGRGGGDRQNPGWRLLERSKNSG